MRRILSTLIFTVTLLWGAGLRAQTVAVVANLKDLGGNNATSPNTFVQFTLQNYGSSIPTIAGSGVFVNPTPPVLTPNSSGLVIGTITPNDLINPAGTYYQVCVFFQGGAQWCNNFLITSATNPWNLNNATPLVNPPAPSGYIAYPRTFVFQQLTPITTWTIIHNFGSLNVVVTCYNSLNTLIIPDTVTETGVNVVTVTFVTAQAGSCVVMNAGNVSLTNQPANAVLLNPNGDQNIIGFNFLHNSNKIPDIGTPWTWTQPQTMPAIISSSANAAASGFVEMASGDSVCWENNPITAAICLSKNSSDVLQFNGNTIGILSVAQTWTAAQTYAVPIISTQVSGTSPFTVASTTEVENLNSNFLEGATWEAPNNIGSSFPATGTFLSLVDSSLSTGCVNNTSGTLGSAGLPCGAPAIQVVYTQTLSGNVSATANTLANPFAIVATMPSSGCPCRVMVSYELYWTSSALNQVAAAWVNDGTNSFASASRQNGTNSVTPSDIGGSSISTTAGYANGATPTFTLNFKSPSNATITAADSTGFAPQHSWFQVTVIQSAN